jgi:SH3-like domain-containing protein
MGKQTQAVLQAQADAWRNQFLPLTGCASVSQPSRPVKALFAAALAASLWLAGAPTSQAQSGEGLTLPVRPASAVRSVAPPPPLMSQEEIASRSSREIFPRMVALRHNKTFGRAGPRPDYPVVWSYERQGLPMLALRGWNGFTQVRDPDGEITWMADRMLLNVPRFVVRPAQGATAILRAGPSATAKPLVQLETSVVGGLNGCENGFCSVEIGSRKGYLADEDLWGSPNDMQTSLDAMRGLKR